MFQLSYLKVDNEYSKENLGRKSLMIYKERISYFSKKSLGLNFT